MEVSKLGFGFMRLPVNDGEIDIAMVQNMVDEYIKSGGNYFDTAYVYHGGKSEVALKTALVDRYPRESFFIADKLPAWELHKQEDVQRVFDEQLKRTGAGYFDYYLLHSLEAHHHAYDEYDCWGWAQKMKAKGLIRHFGFSFHDKPALLDQVLTRHPETEFVQLQINYADWDSPIIYSGGCYETARKHGKPIIVMEPVKGGMLASLKPELEAKMRAIAPGQSAASWAFRYCLSLEGVLTTLSGMTTPEQMADNIATFKNYAPFTEPEQRCLAEVKAALADAPTIGCTGCRYCTDGCPAKISIPDLIGAYNTILTYGEHMRPHFFYGGITINGGKANACTKCGACESVCPQHLAIPEILVQVSKVFDK